MKSIVTFNVKHPQVVEKIIMSNRNFQSQSGVTYSNLT